MLLKRLLQLCLEVADLGVERDQQPDEGLGARCVGLGERGRSSQLLGSEPFLDPLGSGV